MRAGNAPRTPLTKGNTHNMFKHPHERSRKLKKQRTISQYRAERLMNARIPAAAIDAAREDNRITTLRAYTTEGFAPDDGDSHRWMETAKHQKLDEWWIYPMEIVANTPDLPSWQGLDSAGEVIAQG